MAQVPYDSGVPNVAPTTQAPNDLQNVQPTAAAGLEALGEGFAKATTFYDGAAADNAFNDYQSKAIKLLYGDPNKPGPDGQPDTGFMGLKGAAAMQARPQVESTLDQYQKDTLGSLTNDAQKQQFETYSRRYRNSAAMDIGSHTDQQSTAWYSQVQSDTAKNSLDAIAANPDDNKTVLDAASDLTRSYVRQAQINGAQPGDPIYTEAVQNAKKDAFKTQVQSIGTANPARALRMLQKNADLAGSDYTTLYNSLRTRADDQVAGDFVTNRVQTYTGQAQQAYQDSPTNPTQPVYQQVSTSIPGGMSGAGLARLVQVESNGKDVTNKYGYTGYAQFGSAEWKQYGAGGSPHDLGDSVAAAQRYAVANGQVLQNALGRPATDAELYLAHQQGAGGASALLRNPNAPASVVLGSLEKVRANLPTSLQGQASTMTAGQFASYWTHKFNGTTPASVAADGEGSMSRANMSIAPNGAPMSVPEGGIPSSPDQVGQTSVPAVANTVEASASTQPSAPTPGVLPTDIKSQVFQDIDASDMSPEQKQIARTRAAQQVQAYQIANDQNAAEVKAQNDQAMNEYGTQILAGAGSADLQAKLLGDSRLTYEGKNALVTAMMQHADMSVAGASQAYGSGFFKTYQQVIAQPGDPSRLSDPTQIYALAAPGGPLTLAGAQKLVGIMGTMGKSVDDTAVNTTKVSLMQYAKSKISNDTTGMPSIPGVPQHIDAEGERLFNSRFVPRFEAAFDQWTKAGKDPWQFLTQKNVDDIANGIRSPREKAIQELESNQTGLDTSQLTAPVPPPGADPDGWKVIANYVPPIKLSDGSPMPPENWQGAVTALQNDPTPRARRLFDAHFAAAGISADDVLSVLKVEPLGAKASDEDVPPPVRQKPASPAPSAPPALDPRLGLGPYN